jgi:hypothetical protein
MQAPFDMTAPLVHASSLPEGKPGAATPAEVRAILSVLNVQDFFESVLSEELETFFAAGNAPFGQPLASPLVRDFFFSMTRSVWEAIFQFDGELTCEKRKLQVKAAIRQLFGAPLWQSLWRNIVHQLGLTDMLAEQLFNLLPNLFEAVMKSIMRFRVKCVVAALKQRRSKSTPALRSAGNSTRRASLKVKHICDKVLRHDRSVLLQRVRSRSPDTLTASVNADKKAEALLEAVCGMSTKAGEANTQMLEFAEAVDTFIAPWLPRSPLPLTQMKQLAHSTATLASREPKLLAQWEALVENSLHATKLSLEARDRLKMMVSFVNRYFMLSAQSGLKQKMPKQVTLAMASHNILTPQLSLGTRV